MTKDDLAKPGFTRVERVDQPGGKQWNEARDAVVPFGVIQTRCFASYGISTYDFFVEKDRYFVPVKQIEPPPRRVLVTQLQDIDETRFSFLFEADGIKVEKIPRSIPTAAWLARYEQI